MERDDRSIHEVPDSRRHLVSRRRQRRPGLAIPHAAAGDDQMLARRLGTRRLSLSGRPTGTLCKQSSIVKEPTESDWAELREAQLLTSQTVPRVGLAVITDLGDEKDIHPPRKREVGERLALAAKAIAFSQNVVYSGPSTRSRPSAATRSS